jgi:hypothetical protein
MMREIVVLSRRIEPALRRPLLALLRHDAGGVRPVTQRDLEHFVSRGHFQVQRDREMLFQARDVVVGDMAPVLPQVRRDAVGPRRRRGEGGADRIGMLAAPRVSDGRDMVDVDPEAQPTLSLRESHAAFRLPGFSAGMA